MLVISNLMRRVLTWPQKAINLYLNSERCIRNRFSGHPTFYIIRIDYKATGLLAIVKTVLQHIDYAIGKEYIPIVDLKNHKCQYLRPNELGKTNVWERFFKQPAGIGLDDIPQGARIILSSNRVAPKSEFFINVNTVLPQNREKLIRLANLCNRFIIPVEYVRKRTEDYCNAILPKGGNGVLGVLCRGTDYLHKKPIGHPVQPSADIVLKKIIDLKNTLKFNKIYLATEDRQIHQLFKRYFVDDLLDIGQRTYDIGEKQFLCELDRDEYEFFEGPIRYYASMHILSRCEFFVGGMTSGTLAAFMMSPTGGFKYEYVFDLGSYE